MPPPSQRISALLVLPVCLALTGCAAIDDLLPRPQVVITAPSGETMIATLTVGQCFNGLPDSASARVNPVGCTDGHDYELFATLPLPLPLGERTADKDEGDGYPGDDLVAAAAEEGCRAEFESFVNADYASSSLDFAYVTPEEIRWGDPAARSVLCFVGDPAGPVSGTLQGSSR
ncbi:MAG: hypothetical protein JWQ68_1858 [Cryobacterium sp.]|nr:hypothetical protein [Cryobacterium sp.]